MSDRTKIREACVVVTGASRGIGLAIAEECARRGAHLHLQVRSEPEGVAERLKKMGAASVRFWIADLGSRENVERWLQELAAVPVDILINNAGQLTGGLLEEQPLDDIYSMFQVNVLAVVHLTRGLIPGMVKRGRGKIVNNASVSAVMHFPCATTYAASKAAVLALTECLQIELKGTGVSALGLITPGIQTRMFNEIEVKYGANFDVPKDSISPEEYALQVCNAIESDQEMLEPRGATGIGLAIARYAPKLFRWEASRRFRRS